MYVDKCKMQQSKGQGHSQSDRLQLNIFLGLRRSRHVHHRNLDRRHNLDLHDHRRRRGHHHLCARSWRCAYH
eukprot:XP_001705500.1 Hypothetical protein GL50803_34773 [Giardia lamblia ATCC 50803]